MMRAVVFVALVAACVAFPTIDEDLPYSAYLAKFNKNHPKHELPLREAIYLKNVRKIQQHNANPDATSHWAINHLADWTEEEMGSLMGFSSTLHQHRQRLRLGAASPLTHFPQRVNISSLPASVDWTTKGVMTPVKNQGGCGSCWAFAGTEVIESNLYMETGKKMILSPQVYVNCVNNSEHCGGTGGCQGATPDLLFEYAMKNGSALESEVPYVGRDETCKKFTPVVSVENFVDIPSNDNAALMAAVAERPVAVAVAANHFSFYSGGVMSFEECGADLNHAVVVVGYGTDPTYGDFWKIQNSWGSFWGEKGFIRLARSSTDDQNCEWDKNPLDGLGCPGGPDQVKVCGTCGVLYASSYVTGTKAL